MRKGKKNLPLGDNLGELKDELNGGHFVDWISTGP